MRLAAVWFCALLALATSASRAGEAGEGSEAVQHLVYVGGGSSVGQPAGERAHKPFTLGYMRLGAPGQTFFGADVSGEGTMYQNGAPKQGLSLNLLVGRNLFTWDDFRLDAGLLVGARTKSSTCPSYSGQGCFANSESNYDYALNYGAAISWSHKRFMLGLRATAVSRQVLLGVRF
jgi:hypothetical protein